MRDVITARIKRLCELHDMPMPQVEITYTQRGTGVEGTFVYSAKYDSSRIEIIYSDVYTQALLNEAIAHEFAHYMTKEILLLEELCLEDEISQLRLMFDIACEKIAKRLEHIFIGELDAID